MADETGLRMRLSDRVIEDIAMRLGKSGHGFGTMQRRDDTNNLLAAVGPKAWLLPDNCAAKQSSNCEERRISRKRPQLLSDPSIWMQPVARWLQ
ncbi:hypothetical protein N9I60_03225 [Planktomarina temperata]|nr:hypothetical protein [Planktomarina temperata]